MREWLLVEVASFYFYRQHSLEAFAEFWRGNVADSINS
jgi:hypothetical protein